MINACDAVFQGGLRIYCESFRKNINELSRGAAIQGDVIF